jgi:hypothetical protein
MDYTVSMCTSRAAIAKTMRGNIHIVYSSVIF